MCHCKYSFQFCFNTVLVIMQLVHADLNEKKLIKDLFLEYDKRLRPSVNATYPPLNVTFGLALAQLIDVVRSNLYILHLIFFMPSPSDVIISSICCKIHNSSFLPLLNLYFVHMRMFVCLWFLHYLK